MEVLPQQANVPSSQQVKKIVTVVHPAPSEIASEPFRRWEASAETPVNVRLLPTTPQEPLPIGRLSADSQNRARLPVIPEADHRQRSHSSPKNRSRTSSLTDHSNHLKRRSLDLSSSVVQQLRIMRSTGQHSEPVSPDARDGEGLSATDLEMTTRPLSQFLSGVGDLFIHSNKDDTSAGSLPDTLEYPSSTGSEDSPTASPYQRSLDNSTNNSTVAGST